MTRGKLAWPGSDRGFLDQHDSKRLTEDGAEAIALEVSGVARGRITARMADKVKQVSRSEDVDQQWVGIVGFEEPVAALRSSKVVNL